MTLLLKADKIHKKFYDPKKIVILKTISLELYQGESIAIIGASGEGKSTLLQILGTLEPPSSGTLSILSETVNEKNAPSIRNKHIGFVFQSYHLLANYSALENALMPARIGRRECSPHSPIHTQMLSLFERVGLKERLHYRSTLLSGGEKQRVSIARALCNDPEIILADEPSGNLDHTTSYAVHSLLLSLCKEKQKGLIVVTHNRELAALCDHTYILKDGILEKQ